MHCKHRVCWCIMDWTQNTCHSSDSCSRNSKIKVRHSQLSIFVQSIKGHGQPACRKIYLELLTGLQRVSQVLQLTTRVFLNPTFIFTYYLRRTTAKKQSSVNRWLYPSLIHAMQSCLSPFYLLLCNFCVFNWADSAKIINIFFKWNSNIIHILLFLLHQLLLLPHLAVISEMPC